jgi:hypothetical protein
MPRKTGRDPAQFGLFATPLDAMITPEAEVRVIASFVDQLDLDGLGFNKINSLVAKGPMVLQFCSKYTSMVI